MPRVVKPELLDGLPPDHPDAIRSRRDLRRLNGWMRNDTHLVNALERLQKPPQSMVELGAGDGTFMLKVAQRMHPKWKRSVQLTLLDLQPVVSVGTLNSFAALGWKVEVLPANLLQWIQNPVPEKVDLVMANLFLHHFSEAELRSCFEKISSIARVLIACEPRRWFASRVATHLLWAIGCNHVTRHDARVSVQAGFRDLELSELWPPDTRTRVLEYPAGYASHIFVAECE